MAVLGLFFVYLSAIKSMLRPMKLMVVTMPTFFVEEDKILTALFEEGLDVLHLRKPQTPAMFAERLLTLIPKKFHSRIVIHEHFYLKEEFGLKGVHLNAHNPSEPHDHYGHVSCTCRSLEEVKKQKPLHDYVFLHPVYDSISQAGGISPFLPEDLRRAQRDRIIDSNVVALGGITADRILEVKDLGFGGAALMGDLWLRFDVRTTESYRELIEYFREIRRLAD